MLHFDLEQNEDQCDSLEILQTTSGFPWNLDLDPVFDDRPSSVTFTDDVEVTPQSLLDDGSSFSSPCTTLATVVRSQSVGSVDDGVLAVVSTFDRKLFDVNQSSCLESVQSFSYLVGQPSVVQSQVHIYAMPFRCFEVMDGFRL